MRLRALWERHGGIEMVTALAIAAILIVMSICTLAIAAAWVWMVLKA